ncbi:MAG: Gfo/Idh/MocA family oxidoreductase [Candidatus Hydrogenedentes bacterium]|nr:Gfo/Idh/MocA family oxidoreductase [Candidatus Hydrogenedentota bacterium]
MVNIGIMSFAHMHAYSYAACFNALPGVKLAGIWDDDKKRGQAAAKQFNTTYTGNLTQFLSGKMEGVCICSENVKHRSMVEEAAAAGKWILCEKPLSPSLEDAKAMVKACKQAKVGLGAAFPCRFAPTLMAVRDRIRAGEFGEIYAASCTNHGQSPGGWFADDVLAGGGATMDHTVHVVDLMRWIFDREFTKVHCESGNQLHKKTLKTDDLGSLNLEMEGGMQVSHLASWSRPKSYPTWGDVTMEFIGSKGVLYVDAFGQKVNVYSDRAARSEWASYGDNPDLGLVHDFIESIRERRSPCASGEDGVAATAVTVAAYKSIKAGKAVRI